MKRFAQSLSELTSWRRWGVAFLAGVVSVLAMAPFYIWPILFITFSILVWLVDGAMSSNRATERSLQQSRFHIQPIQIRQAALLGWFFGFGYFLGGLFWIGEAFLVEAEKFAWALPFAVSLLPAGLALFYAAAVAGAAFFWRPGVRRIVALAVSFMVAEWLRGHVLTGFPWNVIGYGLTGSDGLMQWASVFGVYGLTFFAVSIFASPAVLAGPLSTVRGRYFPLIMTSLLLMGAVGGYMRLGYGAVEMIEDVHLKIVQPNIPQKKKWHPDHKEWIFRRYLDLSQRDKDLKPIGLEKTTHLIWPESSVPFLLAREKLALKAIAELLPDKTHLIVGALRVDLGREQNKGRIRQNIFNSLYVLNHEAQILSTYDKVHLVPFGEFLPFQEILEAIGLEQLTKIKGGFASGRGPRYLRAPGAPEFVPAICYEIIFSGDVVESDERPKWVVNLTNDAWFGKTTGPYQHLHQARVRAVEEGLPIIRAANTGISAVIDPYGRYLYHLPLGSAGIIESGLPKALKTTFYARYRDFILVILVFLGFSLILIESRKERKNT